MEAAQKPSPLPTSKAGWLRSEMPAAADLIDDLRRQLGPEIVQGALDNLKHGRGYIIDQGAGLALGKVPPTHQVLDRDRRGVQRVVPVHGGDHGAR